MRQNMAALEKKRIFQMGLQVIDLEVAAINNLKERIDEKFFQACKYLYSCKGHIIVAGTGKSGHIANKIAATLASTGSPAFFVHPGDASHGDLGMIKKDDVVIAISNSGSTQEILSILPIIKYLNVVLISLTSDPESPLAKAAHVNIDIGVKKEACPLGLTPTSSTTATLVMGDALAVTLLEIRGFSKNDFALSHPGGMLGKRLLLQVGDLMHTGDDIPKVYATENIKHALLEMTAKRVGMTTVIDECNSKLLGIFTDGDLRRALDKSIDINTVKIKDIMTIKCKTIASDVLAIEALELMEKYNIMVLVITDTNKRVAGVLHMHDILKSGIIPIKLK
jgi:arabinose-5-phosphate isomerase